MSHVRKYEHRIARAASRFVRSEKIDEAMSSFAQVLRDPKIASTLDAVVPTTGKYAEADADRAEEIARTFFEQHAKANPCVARELPPVDVAAAAKKSGLDWS
jgi:hypothetical protein